MLNITDGFKLIAVNLPKLKNILSFFNQPNRTFAAEIADRLKVIPCLEKPNMLYSEYVPFDTDLPSIKDIQGLIDWQKVKKELGANDDDAQIIFWTTDDDLRTALETIKERIQLAMAGVPNETRKALPDCTNIFERVLPGPERMYPDTDSKPISLSAEFIEATQKDLPIALSKRYQQLSEWKVPKDAYTFLLRNNLIPMVDRIASDFSLPHSSVATFFAHDIKHLCRKHSPSGFRLCNVDFSKIYELYKFIVESSMDLSIIDKMSEVMLQKPELSFAEILKQLNFVKYAKDHVFGQIPALLDEFSSHQAHAQKLIVMGKLRSTALGNVNLCELAGEVEKRMGAKNV
jgi:glutamyl-tRNA(Gln) amidotransferase subunit E